MTDLPTLDPTATVAAPTDRPEGGAPTTRGRIVAVAGACPVPSTAGLSLTGRAAPGAFRRVTEDLYRDVHKGLRSELAAVVAAAGSVDPCDREALADLSAQVRSVVAFLESHAEHEDRAVLPALAGCRPDLHAANVADHEVLDRHTADLVVLADALVGAPEDELRDRAHHLYLELAAFTGAYLLHQDVEERVIMPALEAELGRDGVLAIHQAIVGGIPPEEMARSLAVMLPAMNVDDRAELLGGMRAGAPPEVFDGVRRLAASVLDPVDAAALERRLAG